MQQNEENTFLFYRRCCSLWFLRFSSCVFSCHVLVSANETGLWTKQACNLPDASSSLETHGVADMEKPLLTLPLRWTLWDSSYSVCRTLLGTCYQLSSWNSALVLRHWWFLLCDFVSNYKALLSLSQKAHDWLQLGGFLSQFLFYFIVRMWMWWPLGFNTLLL